MTRWALAKELFFPKPSASRSSAGCRIAHLPA